MLKVVSHDKNLAFKGLLNVDLCTAKYNIKLLLCDHFTDCSPRELWNMPTTGLNFLPDVSLLEDAAQYPSCDAGSVGSAVLLNTTLNTATVAYYTGTTAGSTTCFVCNNDSEYELNTTTNVKFCQSNGTWSKSAISCGMHLIM